MGQKNFSILFTTFDMVLPQTLTMQQTNVQLWKKQR